MKNKQLEANISMTVSKIFSGLNMNALKFLLPIWIAPVTGVTIRVAFASAAFWIIGFFVSENSGTFRDKFMLFILGAFGIYGFMYFYLTGLSLTTPVSSSIFVSLEPIWVFLMMLIFYKERGTWKKIIGIIIGLSGALLCISTQTSDDLASNAFLGNIFCLSSSILYSVYLVVSDKLLKDVGNITMLKYTFLGATVSALIVNSIYGFEAKLFSLPIEWAPLSVLIFVLIFPTVISYMLIPIGIKYLDTTLVSIYGYVILIVATTVALILGQDRFSWYQFFAVILICCSVYLVEVSGKKLDKKVPQ